MKNKATHEAIGQILKDFLIEHEQTGSEYPGYTVVKAEAITQVDSHIVKAIFYPVGSPDRVECLIQLAGKIREITET